MPCGSPLRETGWPSALPGCGAPAARRCTAPAAQDELLVAGYLDAAAYASNRRSTARYPTRDTPVPAHTVVPRSSRLVDSSPRSPPSKRVAGLQRSHAFVEQLILHRQIANLGLQPLHILLAPVARSLFQRSAYRRETAIAPRAQHVRRHSELAGQRLQIFSA